MAGFNINKNQDITGLFKTAEKAATTDNDDENTDNIEEQSPINTEHIATNTHNGNNDNTHNVDNNLYKDNTTSENLVPIAIIKEKVVNEPIVEENLFASASRKTVNTNEEPVDTNLLIPQEVILENNENNENNAPNDNNVNTVNNVVNDETVNNVISENNVDNVSSVDIVSNDERVEVQEVNNSPINIMGMGTPIPKSVVQKIIVVSNHLTGLEPDSLFFVSQLLTKSNYSGELTDLIFNIVNSSDNSVNDVKVLYSILGKDDRVERVFELLELDFDNLVRISEIISLITGDIISGDDVKSRSRSVELGVQKLSVDYNGLIDKTMTSVTQILDVLR